MQNSANSQPLLISAAALKEAPTHTQLLEITGNFALAPTRRGGNGGAAQTMEITARCRIMARDCANYAERPLLTEQSARFHVCLERAARRDAGANMGAAQRGEIADAESAGGGGDRRPTFGLFRRIDSAGGRARAASEYVAVMEGSCVPGLRRWDSALVVFWVIL